MDLASQVIQFVDTYLESVTRVIWTNRPRVSPCNIKRVQALRLLIFSSGFCCYTRAAVLLARRTRVEPPVANISSEGARGRGRRRRAAWMCFKNLEKRVRVRVETARVKARRVARNGMRGRCSLNVAREIRLWRLSWQAWWRPVSFVAAWLAKRRWYSSREKAEELFSLFLSLSPKHFIAGSSASFRWFYYLAPRTLPRRCERWCNAVLER